MAADLPIRMRLLAHPVTTGALAALVVNDRVLKPWAFGLSGPLDHPVGALTGKISDVAGVALVAMLVAVATGRARMAVGAVAIAFAALKLSPVVAELVAPLLGGTTRADPTDLVALLALVPLVAFLTRHLVDDPAGSDAPADPVAPASLARRAPGPILTALVVVLTVPAVTATSCEEPLQVDPVAVGADGSLWARVGEPLRVTPDAPDPSVTSTPWTTDPATPPTTRPADDGGWERWARSTDGGRTWQEEPDPPPDADARRRAARLEEDCTPDGTCYRIVDDADPGDPDLEGRRRVEEGRDGVWTTSFSYSDEQWARLQLRSPGCGGGADPDDGLRSVLATDDAVIVSNGSQGVLRLGPDGEWERVAVLGLAPLRIDGPTWFADLLYAPVVLGASAVGLMALALALGRGWGRAFAVGAVAGGAAVVLLAIDGVLLFAQVDYATAGPPLALASLLVFAVSLLVTTRPRRPERRGGDGPIAIVAVAAVVAVLVLALSGYQVLFGDGDAVSTPLVVAVAALTLLGGVVLAVRSTRPTPGDAAGPPWPPPPGDTGSWPPPPPGDTGSWPPPPPGDTGSWPPPPPGDTGSWPPPPPGDTGSWPPPGDQPR